MAGKSQSQVTTLDTEDEAAAAAVVESTPATKITGANHDAQLSGKKRTVTVHATDGDGGSDAVTVGVNGFVYQIPRNVPCEVPDEVIQVLQNAKTTIMSFGQGGAVVERTVPRFAFSVN